MSSEKVLKQLGVQKEIYKMAKTSFEKHSRNCKHQYIGAEGGRRCSHSEGGTLCEFSCCPLVTGRVE